MHNKFLDKLLPCPFCGGKPKITFKGNDHTKTRSITIKCSDCRVERTDSAIRYDHNWLKNMALGQWNTRVDGEQQAEAIDFGEQSEQSQYEDAD